MYSDGFWILVGAIIVGAFMYAAVRENQRAAQKKTEPSYNREAALRHEATREQWRKILAEQERLSDRNQKAYMSFVCMETALNIAAAAGRGYRFSGKDLMDAADLQQKQIARARELLGQMNGACARCDAEERLTGSKDGPSRPAVLQMAAERDATLLEVGWVNELMKFRRMFEEWRDTPITG
jgi:hypothetical protein